MFGNDGLSRAADSALVSRRRFLTLVGSTVWLLAACQPAPAAPPAKPTEAPKPAEAPKPTEAAKPAEAPKPAAAATSAAPAPTAAAAAPTAAPAAAAKPANQGGTLVVAADQMADHFIPAGIMQGWASFWILNNVYDRLYVSRDYKTLTPSLATSHTVSPDGLTYTFQLRKGVKFHDGTPFNADAVEFNYMRYLDKDHPFYEPNATYKTQFLTNVKSVKAKDESTVEVVRETPDSGWLASLTPYYAGIMSPTAIKKFGVKDVGVNPIGTGPFVFEKKEGNQASMRAFDEYWGGRPLLDRVIARGIPDPQAMTASLLAGDVDVTTFIDFKDIDTLRKNASLNVTPTTANSTMYIAVNQSHAALKDARARQALAHAINKQEIIDVVYNGQAEIAGGLIAPPVWAHAPQFKDYYKYDQAMAKKMLDEVGGPTDVSLLANTAGVWPRVAELVQAHLNAVGFKLTIEKADPAGFVAQLFAGERSLVVQDAIPDHHDPEYLYVAIFGCDNPRGKRHSWCDPAWDQLRAKQAAETDQEKRKAIIWDMEKELLDMVTLLPNHYANLVGVSNKRVGGYMPVATHQASMFLDKISVTK
jgi:ABC-type transport system substrate-binding protein